MTEQEFLQGLSRLYKEERGRCIEVARSKLLFDRMEADDIFTDAIVGLLGQHGPLKDYDHLRRSVYRRVKFLSIDVNRKHFSRIKLFRKIQSVCETQSFNSAIKNLDEKNRAHLFKNIARFAHYLPELQAKSLLMYAYSGNSKTKLSNLAQTEPRIKNITDQRKYAINFIVKCLSATDPLFVIKQLDVGMMPQNMNWGGGVEQQVIEYGMKRGEFDKLLNKTEREVLMQYFIDKKLFPEISECLDIKENTVKSMKSTGIKKIRAFLSEYN